MSGDGEGFLFYRQRAVNERHLVEIGDLDGAGGDGVGAALFARSASRSAGDVFGTDEAVAGNGVGKRRLLLAVDLNLRLERDGNLAFDHFDRTGDRLHTATDDIDGIIGHDIGAELLGVY